MIYAKRIFLYLLACTFAALAAQDSRAQNANGLPGSAAFASSKNDAARAQTGSFSLGYQQSGCGLNFAADAARLAKRNTSFPGQNQPVTLNIGGLPCPQHTVIEQAFLYWIMETSAVRDTESVVLRNPAGQTQTFSGVKIGEETPGKCWGCDYTRHYRADVTAAISGNGGYQISDLPANAICMNGGDTDGAFLIVIYRNTAEDYEGTILLHDGLMAENNGALTHTINGFNACDNSSFAEGFVVAGDMQNDSNGPWNCTINGTQHGIAPQFFNYEKHPTTINSGQTTSQFGTEVVSDCFTWILAGLYYRHPICNAGCAPDFADGQINSDTMVCVTSPGITLTLTGQTGTVETWQRSTDNGGTWQNLSGTAGQTQYTTPPHNTDTRYRVLIQAPGCQPAPTQSILVEVMQKPNPGFLTGGATICQGDAIPTLDLQGFSGQVVRWEAADDCANFTNATTIAHTAAAYTPVNLAKTTCFRAMVGNSGCPPEPSAPMLIEVIPTTTNGIINGTSQLCRGESPGTLTLNGHSGQILRWESSVDCPGFSNPAPFTNTTTTFTTNQPINLETCFRVVISNATCARTYSDVFTIQVEDPPQPGLMLTDTAVCSGEPVGSFTLTNYTGSILRWEQSNDCPGFATVAPISFNGATYGAHTTLTQETCYRAILKNAGCPETPSDAATVSIIGQIAPGAVSADATICETDPPPQLSLNGASDPSVRWESSTDGLTWNPIAHTGTTYNPPVLFQTTWFRAVVGNGSCAPQPSQPAVITVEPRVAPGALAADDTVCSGGNKTLFLNGQNADVQFWQRSDDGGATWTDIQQTGASFTANSLTQAAQFRAVVGNGFCPDETTNSVEITVAPQNQNPALTGAATVCSGDNTGALTLAPFFGRVVHWEAITNNGATITTLNHTGDIYTYTDLTETTVFRARIATDACPEEYSAEVTVEVLPNAQAGMVTGGSTVCQSASGATLELQGYTDDIIRWESSADCPGFASNVTTIAHTQPTFTTPSLSETRCYRAVVQKANCPPRASMPAVVEVSVPSAGGSVAGATAVCIANNALTTLTLSGETGNVLFWQKSTDNFTDPANTEEIAFTGTQYTAQDLTSETCYRAVVQNGACPPDTSTPHCIAENALSRGGNVRDDQTICEGDTPAALQLSGERGAIIRWEFSTDAFAGSAQPLAVTSPTFSPSAQSQTTCFRAVVKNQDCPETPSDAACITVEPQSAGGAVQNDQTVCDNNNGVSLTLTNFVGDILFWERAETSAFANPATVNQTSATLNAGPLTETACFRAVVESHTCGRAFSQPACVTVVPATSAGAPGPAASLCETGNSGTLTLTGYTGQVLRWERSFDNFNTNLEVINEQDDEIAYQNLTQDACYRAIVKSGICDEVASDIVCLEVGPPTIAGAVSGDTLVCAGDPVGEMRLSGQRGNVLFWEASTDNFTNDVRTINHTGTSLAPGGLEQSECFRAVVQNAGCDVLRSAPACADVTPRPDAGAVVGGATVCKEGNAGLLVLSGHDGAILRWEYSTDNFQTFDEIQNTTITYNYQNLSETTYFRAVISKGVCSRVYSDTAVVEVIDVELDLNPTPVSCNGETDSRFDPVATGGGTPYSFFWRKDGVPFSTSQQILNLAPGEYCLEAEDRFGCRETGCHILENPPYFSARLAEKKDVTCFNENNGLIRLDVSGGVQSYSYQWSSGATMPDLIDAAPGAYTVTVTDANGCVRTLGPYELRGPQPMQALTSYIRPPRCHGENTGGLGVNIIGGQPPYTYVWSNNARTEDLLNIPAGTYALTATDANGCDLVQSWVVPEAPRVAINVQVVRDLTCYESNDGVIQVTITGGQQPYNARWQDGVSTLSRDNLPAGEYRLRVFDAKNCAVETAFNITQPTPLALEVINVVSQSCEGRADGGAEIRASGGNAPYTFAWSDGGAGSLRMDLLSGPLSVTATDAKGCRQTLHFELPKNSELTVIENHIRGPRCAGWQNGVVALTVLGGQPGYSYQWSNGATAQDLANLGPGNYVLTITDARGCKLVRDWSLTEPPPLEILIGGGSEIACSGGKLTADVSGGKEPYLIFWNTGVFGPETEVASPGLYSALVIDGNGCTERAEVYIDRVTPLEAVANTTQPLCENQTGAIELTASGGTPEYVFKWADGATGANRTELSPGVYSWTATDAKGCSVSGANEIIAQSPVSASIAQLAPPGCQDRDGQLEARVSGGSGPYSFNWSNGATTQTATRLSAGAYSVTITDANGCQAEAAHVLDGFPALKIELKDFGGPSCFGGSDGYADVEVTGGKPGYDFFWLGAPGMTSEDLSGASSGVYILFVTDARGCRAAQGVFLPQAAEFFAQIATQTDVSCADAADGSAEAAPVGGTGPFEYEWNNGQTGPALSGVDAGTYAVIVTDANGCRAEAVAVVGAPAPLTLQIDDLTGGNCGGAGALEAAASGGTGPYEYQWSNSAKTARIDNLPTGAYSVTATDANNCTIAGTATVATTAGAGIDVAISQTDTIRCAGASTGGLKAEVAGGTGPYNYQWSGGRTGRLVDNLPAGTYTVTVFDANGCAGTATFDLKEPAPLQAEADAMTPPLCSGDANGAIDLAVSGGTAPYRYIWNTGASTQDVSGLAGGTYSVIIIDANNCAAARLFRLSAPFALDVQPILLSQPTCDTCADGRVAVPVQFGTPPYTFSIGAAAFAPDSVFEDLLPGTYTFFVKDANGCTASASLTLEAPESASCPTPQLNAETPGFDWNPVSGASGYVVAWRTPGGSWTEVELPAGANGFAPEGLAPGAVWEARVRARCNEWISLWSGVETQEGAAVRIGAAHTSASAQFQLYPNPASDRLTVAWALPEPDARLTLRDISGRKVLARTLSGASGSVVLETKTLPAGVYLCVFQSASGERIASEKLLIVR